MAHPDPKLIQLTNRAASTIPRRTQRARQAPCTVPPAPAGQLQGMADREHFHTMLDGKSVDALQADAARCAAITEWLRVAATIAASKTPVLRALRALD